MRGKAHTRYLCLLWSCVAAAGWFLAPHSGAQDTNSLPDLLTLDEAIQIALAHNRSLSIADLEIDKSRWQLSEFKAKALPSWSTTATGSMLLTPVAFTFKKGDFGRYPGIGPIPRRRHQDHHPAPADGIYYQPAFATAFAALPDSARSSRPGTKRAADG